MKTVCVVDGAVSAGQTVSGRVLRWGVTLQDFQDSVISHEGDYFHCRY